MNLPISINGVDFTDLLEYTTRSEAFRKVSGDNAGTSIGGDDIYDVVSTKYDLTCTTKPCKPERLIELHNEIIQTPCEVEYFSFWRNATVQQKMNVENAEALVGLLKQSGPILKNIELFFKQK